MLTILGRTQTTCEGLTRRRLLQAGGAGLFGLSLPKLLAAEADSPVTDGRAKSVIFLFLFGGPSRLETCCAGHDSRTVPTDCVSNSGVANL